MHAKARNVERARCTERCDTCARRARPHLWCCGAILLRCCDEERHEHEGEGCNGCWWACRHRAKLVRRLTALLMLLFLLLLLLLLLRAAPQACAALAPE